jgi:hypothetical protein
VAPKFRYHLFDRVLVSDMEHVLLDSFQGKDIDDSDVVRLRLSSEALEPHGEAVFDDSNFDLQILNDGSQSLFVLNPFSAVAVVSGDGLNVTLHPTDSSKPLDLKAQRALDARIVTWVLSRIPILWGSPAIHGANLSFEQGSLLLLGQSGAGKSTLSQHLSKTHGATLHDDDTSLIKLGTSPTLLVPMGAAPRVRQDAATALGLSGRLLEGYAGGKIALTGLSNHLSIQPPNLCAIVEIVQRQPLGEVGRESTPDLVRMTYGEAMLALHSHLFQTDLRAHQRELGFWAAEQLAKIPTWRLTYTRDSHGPKEISQVIYTQILWSTTGHRL